MCSVNIDNMLDDSLKKRVRELNDLYEWINECGSCAKLSFLHVWPCLISEENLPPDKIVELWSEFKSRMKSILEEGKIGRNKAIEKNYLYDYTETVV